MKGIYEKLLENAGQYPDKTAVISLNGSYTYSQFLKKVEEKSEELKQKNITMNNTVAVYMDKSEEYLITIYALIKNHIVYVPVESDYPKDRLLQIAEIAGCDRIINNFNMSSLDYERKEYSDAIYILFTSGSSGKPKGVIVREESILMYIDSAVRFMDMHDSYTSILKTPINFALALHETFLIFNSAGTIVIPENHSEKNPSLLAECICKNKVDFLDVVPAVLRKLAEQKNADEIFSNIRKIFCAGEVLDKKFADEFRERFDSVLFNAYGMTETNGASFMFDFKKEYDDDSVPIGEPIDCIRSYTIIDENANEVPDGTVGELCYGKSPLLSRYCGNDGVNYITLSSGEKVMKTGDLVRRVNGLLFYCGRCDNQVKINGNRVELEEIEKHSEKIDFISAAIAGVYRRNDRNKIVLFAEMTKDIENAEVKVRRFLRENVPTYMIPAKICFTDKLMRLPNGKKDRKSQIADFLENRKLSREVSVQNLPPLQRMLCISYVDIIKNRILPDVDFFEMGGDSFGMMTLLENIYEVYGVKISTAEFLNDSTVINMEKLILEKRKNTESRAKTAANISDTYELTDIQLSYFFDRKYNENGETLCTSSYRELVCNDFNIDRFRKVINKIIKRHDILRTVFNEDGTQTVLKNAEAEIEEVTISDISEADIKRREYADKKLDITKAPVLGICVQYLSEKKAIVGIHTDGLVMDGRSLMILTDEINILYADIDALSDEAETRYADYVEYRKALKDSDEYKKDKEYWDERRKNLAPNIELPLNKYSGIVSGASSHIEFSESKWSALEKYAEKNGVTTFVTLLTILGLSLKILTKENKYLICIPEDSRPETGEYKKEMGVFSNFIFFEFDGADGRFTDKVKANQKQLLELKKHHLFSGTENLREAGAETGEVGNGIVPVVFTSIIFDESGEQLFEKRYFESHSSNIPLEFVLDKISGKVWLTVNYVRELLNVDIIRQIEENIRNITDKLVSGSAEWENVIHADISEHDKKVWEEVNSTDTDMQYQSIAGMINNSISAYGDSIAIENEKEKITYSELRNKVAGYCRVISEKAPDRKPVCIFMEKSPEQILAVTACIFLGVPYMPLEEDIPLKRLEMCVSNTKCETIICNGKRADELKSICRNVIIAENVEECSNGLIPAKTKEDDLFVIIHTSGSTGVPKAVMIMNKSVYNNVMYVVDRYNIGNGDAAIALTNLAHDMSVFDIVGMLATGGKIVVPVHEKRKDPLHWLEIIKKCGVNIWNSVPAMQEMYITTLNNNMITPNYKMKLFIHGGDYFRPEVAQFLYSNFHDAGIVSVGGPTETSVWNIYHEVESEDFEKGFIPYGRPMANNRYYVLDKNLRPVSFGVTGYMYASGIGVSKGYMSNPEKTKEVFIEHPDFNVLMYNTGDLGRYLDNGEIEFMGREDFQVKINGKRIETEEIAKAVMKCDGVKSAYAVADTEKKTIYAFYIAGSEIEKDSFIKVLLSYLPEYMIPSKFIRLDAFPLTANGKTDRAKLIEIARTYTVATESAFNDLSADELEMKELYDSIIDNDSYSPDDPFLIAGGNSLKAVQMIYALKEKYKIEIGMAGFFENSSLRKLTAYVKKLQEEQSGTAENSTEIVSESEADESSKWEPFGLSELQQAYIVGRENKMTLDIVTHVFVEYECNCYDNEKFLRVVDKLAKRHEVFRMKLSADGTQRFVKDVPEMKIPVTDLSGYSERKQKKYIGYIREKMIRYRLDLNDVPLARIHVNILGENRAVIQFYFDALICDGFSYGILYNEFEALYENENAQLASHDFTFKDYIECLENQKKSREYEKAKNYWLKRIENFADPVTLPFKTEPENLTSLQCDINECNISIANWMKIKNIAEKRGITGFVVLYTAFSEVIARWNFKKKFILNVPISNRPTFHKDIVNMVGETATFILTEVESRPEETFFETCLRNQKQIWDATDNNLFTGVELLREIYKSNDSYGNNIAPIVFSTLVDTPQGVRKALKADFWETNTSQVWIDIDAGIINDIMAFNWNTTKGLFDKEMIRDMTNLQMELLNKLADDESQWDKRQELELPERDRNFINKAVIDEMEISAESIQEKIKNSFKKYADKVFVSEEGKEYTYAQTEKSVNAKINELRKAGMQKDDHVAVVIGKSYEQIVCTLAVICAGGVYVPFEEDVPQKRLEYCVDNTDCKFIISDASRVTKNIKAVNIPYTLNSESDDAEYVYKNDEDVQAIIHTSGSTGKPKAVMVCQKGIKNSVEYTLKKFEIGSDDAAIALTNLSHDMSMFDLFGMAFAGGKIVVINEKHIKDPVYWIKYIISENVTIWNSVPAMLNMLSQVMEQEGVEKLESIRRVFTGGDYISVPLMNRLRKSMPSAMLVSVGGPTETTIWNIYHIITDEDMSRDKIPYGHPIANNRYTIRDENGRIAPYGVTGLMYCTGVGVTKGYYNDPESTAEKYTTDENGNRMYCTGDLGKYLPDGEIEFMGRNDFQVKINGKRIELSEIENGLRQCSGVIDAAAKVSHDGKQIWAYYIADSELNESEIVDKLLESLPVYMIPKSFTRMEKFPLSRTNKIERKLLPDPTVRTSSGETETSEEAGKLVAIARDTLSNENITLSDNFFISGGDSLLAIVFCKKIEEEFSVSFGLTDLFEAPEFSSMMEKIEAQK